MKTYNGLPLYSVDIVDDEDVFGFLGVSTMSMVDEPAVEKKFLYFSKNEPKMAWFAYAANSDKRTVTGVALRADYPIIRKENGEEFYVTYPPEAIEKLVEKFMMEKRTATLNVLHNSRDYRPDVFLTESFILRDTLRYAMPEFDDVANGSWMVTYKVNDDKTWEQVKSGELKGFSVEMAALLKDDFKKRSDSISLLEQYKGYCELEKLLTNSKRNGGL